MIYPEAMKSECIICGKNITFAFPLCRKHFEVYGSKPEFWPEWLRYMWNSDQRRRRDTIKKFNNEVSIEFLEEELYYVE